MVIFNNILRVLSKYGILFVQGTGMTLLLSALTVFFGVVVGTLLSLQKTAKFKPLRALATAYIEIIRGTPLLLQLYFFYFLLPEIFPMFELSKFACIAVALAINSSAYVSEIIRAGIQAVDRGQSEAARSLGLNGRQTMIKVVLPQAIRNILPALCNEFVMVIKESSLASTFFVGDLMTQYKTISGALYLVIEPLMVCGAIYFILTFTLSKGIAALERRMASGD